MKAKLVKESLDDVFQPKSEKDVDVILNKEEGPWTKAHLNTTNIRNDFGFYTECKFYGGEPGKGTGIRQTLGNVNQSIVHCKDCDRLFIDEN